MIKKGLLLILLLTMVLLTSCKTKQTTVTPTKETVEVYNFNELIDAPYDSNELVINETTIQLSEEYKNTTVDKYKEHYVVSQYDDHDTKTLVTLFEKSGKRLWEKEINRDIHYYLYPIYLKNGIIVGNKIDNVPYTFKYDFNGNEVWKLKGYFSQITTDHGLFALLIDEPATTLISLDAYGNILYKKDITITVPHFKTVGIYKDQSLLYYDFNLETDTASYIKIGPTGQEVFRINTTYNMKPTFMNEELYLVDERIPTIQNSSIIKYDINGNKVYEKNGSFQLRKLTSESIFLYEQVDSINYLTKYDSFGNLVFRYEAKINFEINYLSDGSIYFHTLDASNLQTIVKLDANGNVLSKSAPLPRISAIVNVPTTPNDAVAYVSVGEQVGEAGNAKVFVYNQQTNQLTSYEFNFAWKLSDRLIVYKEHGTLGYLFVKTDGTILKKELEVFVDFYNNGLGLIRNSSNDSLVFGYGIYSKADPSNSIDKIIKLNSDGQLVWEMNSDESPIRYVEFTNGEFAFIQKDSSIFTIKKYDAQLNLTKEMTFKQYETVYPCQNGFLSVYFGETGGTIKVFDQNLNPILEGKYLDTAVNGYYVLDQNNNVKEVLVKLN